MRSKGVYDEERAQDETYGEAVVHRGAVEAAATADLGEAVDDERETQRQEHEAEQVESVSPITRRDGRNRRASTSATRPIGTLTKKIQRHEVFEMMTPPITGPRTGPSNWGTPIIPIT